METNQGQLNQASDLEFESMSTTQDESQLQQPAETEQEAGQPESGNDASELIEQLNKAKQAGEQTSETSEQQAEEPKETEEDFSKFEQDFQKYFGVSPKDAFATVNRLQEYVAQSEVAQQKQQLANDWGVDLAEVDVRIPKMQEYLKTLPEEQQAALDNVEGAKLIWSYLQRNNATPSAPTSMRGRQSSPTTNQVSGDGKPRYKLSALQKLPKNEYRKHQHEINQAFLDGRVEMDVDNISEF